jgi:hypothetical protein
MAITRYSASVAGGVAVMAEEVTDISIFKGNNC